MTLNLQWKHLPLSHADMMQTSIQKLKWLKRKGLGPGAQMNCLYKSLNKYSMSGDLTSAEQLHITRYPRQSKHSFPILSSVKLLFHLLLVGLYPMQCFLWCCRVKWLHVCLHLLFCSTLFEPGHAVSGWWWWWLSKVRMSPESGWCERFL